jgi:hypothetical protein
LKRYRQTIEEVQSALSNIETSWKDDHSQCVIDLLAKIPLKKRYGPEDIAFLLNQNYSATITIIRLFLDVSKDEFETAVRTAFPKKGFGIKLFKSNPQAVLDFFGELKLYTKMTGVVNRPLTWYDIIVERLKAGRGSAIKGQARGRFLENHVEEIIKCIFSEYDVRCRFVGAGGDSTEKTDFAIPSKTEPRILVEVKAYGATGSKQTDILGDVSRIVEEKRHDTTLLIVTDGVTWNARLNDLRKLINLQNHGDIARIYTLTMDEELKRDLKQLKLDHDL